MATLRFLPLLILITSLLLALQACSDSSRVESPVKPGFESIPGITDNLPVVGSIDTHSRSPMAVYEVVIDPHAQTFTVTPIERVTHYHFPLNTRFHGILEITDYEFEPDFWADIKITHPIPGSNIMVFDPRVIAIVPAKTEAHFVYPILGVGGNNRVVKNSDGYTRLFDDPSIPGNVNPFKAYFKGEPYRVWSDVVLPSETQRWHLNLDGFAGTMEFQLVVDVSTNYPFPSTPVVDNAPEPVDIKASIGLGLKRDGGNAEIAVTLLDWQGYESIGGVKVEAPDIFSGTIELAYAHPGDKPDEYVFTGTIYNENHPQPGEFNYMVAAWDQETGIHIYKVFTTVIDNGMLVWAKRAGGTEIDYGYGIAALSDDSTIVTGTYAKTYTYKAASATFGEGEPNETTLFADGLSNAYIARYNPDGTLEWVLQVGGSDGSEGRMVTALSDDSFIVTGLFSGTATFGEIESNQILLYSHAMISMYIARYTPDGTVLWAKGIGASQESPFDAGYIYGVTSLPDNSFIITGSIVGSIIFGLDEPNQTVLSSNTKLFHDVFIARYNSDGSLLWAKKSGGDGSDHGSAITTLSDDTIVVAGDFRDTITFDEGEPNETTLITPILTYSLFVAAYSPDGSFVGARRIRSDTEPIQALGLVTLSDDTIIMCGRFRSTTVFGEWEPNETTLTPIAETDAFFARYNQNGTLAWVKKAGGYGRIGYRNIASLSDDTMILTGYFSDIATFGEGELNETMLTSEGDFDLVIARYNPDGTLMWARRAGGTKDAAGNFITTLSDNSPVVSGQFSGTAIFGENEPNETVLESAGDLDIFIARFEP